MLIYIGNGFIVGIPARDLSAEEVEQLGGEKYLVGTGLYEKAVSDEPPAVSENQEKERLPRRKITASQ